MMGTTNQAAAHATMATVLHRGSMVAYGTVCEQEKEQRAAEYAF